MAWSFQSMPFLPSEPYKILPFGQGKSYGDSCLNDGGILLETRHLNRFISFDRKTGVLRCEAGVLLKDILALTVPSGWFLPVVPGTELISLGGAVANDIHGKNHHEMGTIGRHILGLELLRSDQSRMYCSPKSNPDLFNATIGGLGLTGLITFIDIQLFPGGDQISTETIRFNQLEEFFEISDDSAQRYQYTVAWVDCSSHFGHLGRGVFFRGTHLRNPSEKINSDYKIRNLVPGVPEIFPGVFLNHLTVNLFNLAYFHKHKTSKKQTNQDYKSFFFPLDGIKNWNRIYGRKGLRQYQFVLPKEKKDCIRKIFGMIGRSGLGSFLAVFKEFGDLKSPGILSFPGPGYTLALDFPAGNLQTLKLFAQLDQMIAKNGGRLYPAKDSHMSPEMFKACYPEYKNFRKFIDPAFSSDFSKRVNLIES